MLDQSIIEIGIVRTPFNSSRFNCRFLSAEPMVAAMTREWDWCPGQDVIPVRDLAGKPLIIYRRFNQLLHDTFEAADVRPDIYCRNDDARTTVLWANAGLGVAIAPAAALNLAAHENLRVKQIDEEKLRTRLVAIWRQDRYLSTAGEKFLAALEMEEKA
jgi:DNA-binding transcriptional LysR family regulator